ncbi:hypothetical protein QQ020_29590 [Fulvivirgaceae bacterium BMA12]|uniref:YCII-related domain-containing protein n=1 Tax=Agaribacillus aureus TaxID=3051825 RepID=A0ABT8LJ06_9BACT|nr:hypothetical protein [Fulvivirgaceae bacterium BMA12]
MKQYLILMQGGVIHSDQMSQDEKHQHFKAWGAYLSQLDATGKLISGFPLAKGGEVLNKWGAESKDGLDINAYMVLKASDYEEVEKHLVSCPFLEGDDASFIIKEVKPDP